MKRILPVLLLAGLSLAFYGCSSSPSGTEAARGAGSPSTTNNGAGMSNQDEARQLEQQGNVGGYNESQVPGTNDREVPSNTNPALQQGISPYGH